MTTLAGGRGSWLAFGLLAQLLFGLRFLMQWLASEKEGKSVIPPGFWYLSLLGGAGMLAYAIHIKDPVVALGQAAGVFIYARNLALIGRGGPSR